MLSRHSLRYCAAVASWHRRIIVQNQQNAAHCYRCSVVFVSFDHNRKLCKNGRTDRDVIGTWAQPLLKSIRRGKGPGDLFQIDLADLVNISSHNDGYRYLLTCIDVFTKRVWAVPTKTKSGREVSRAFEKILTDGYKPDMVQSDKGTEFLNSTFQSMLKRQDIKFYTRYDIS